MINQIVMAGNIARAIILGKPYKLNFAVTSLCNSRCTTCNIWKTYKKNPESVKKELRIEEIEKIFKKLPNTVIWLSLTGGEPFLRDDFDKIIISAVKNIRNLKMISIPSNGISTKRILSVIKNIMRLKEELRIIITLSIDGPEKVHNKIRGLNCYETTWSTYTELKELTKNDKRFEIGVETTVSGKNVDYLGDYFKEIIKERNPHLTLTVAHNAALYKNESNSNLSPTDIEKVRKIASVIIKSKSMFSPQQIIERIYAKNIISYLKNPKKMIVPCAAFKSSFSLLQNGDVAPCLMWNSKIGNLRDYDYDIKKIFNSEKAKHVRRLIRKGNCPICWTPCEAYQSIISNILNFKLVVF